MDPTNPDNKTEWLCVLNPFADPTKGCPLGALDLELMFPDCLEDTNSDSHDHRSHMTYSVQQKNSADRVCPSTHSTPVPQLELKVRYRGVTQPWSLSSGPPLTAHGDFLNSWDQAALERLVEVCIRPGLGGAIC